MSLSKYKSARCRHKITYVFLLSSHYSCQILMKLEFFDRFSKNAHVKDVPYGQTDMTKIIAALRSFVNAPTNE
jgi:hypothetical protein